MRTWNPLFPNVTANATDFDDAASVGSWCDLPLYAPDKWGAFHSAAVLTASDASAAGRPTWFYTSTAGQNETAAAAAVAQTGGTIKVVLAEVGLFRVCLVPAGSQCYPSHCVTVELYQPPEDYIEVDSTSITEKTFTRWQHAYGRYTSIAGECMSSQNSSACMFAISAQLHAVAAPASCALHAVAAGLCIELLSL
eukprot:15985-Heterococcus_DN1.PRE.2